MIHVTTVAVIQLELTLAVNQRDVGSIPTGHPSMLCHEMYGIETQVMLTLNSVRLRYVVHHSKNKLGFSTGLPSALVLTDHLKKAG